MMVSIRVSNETKEKLVKIAGKLQAERGRRVSLNEAIDFLIEFYESRSNESKHYGLKDALEPLITEWDDGTEDIDKVIYDVDERTAKSTSVEGKS